MNQNTPPMTQGNGSTTEQMNEAIGIFMGGFWKEFKSGNFRQKRFYYKDEAFAWVKSPENLNYHKDWNELMPVVEKIESIYDDFHGYFGVHISSNGCTIQGTKLRLDAGYEHYAYFNDVNHETKLLATYHMVYQFITWYNQQTTTNE